MIYKGIFKMCTPFVKWTQIEIHPITQFLPKNIDVYAEPFVGGGSVLFYILSSHTPSRVIINDINADLINAYINVRDNAGEMIERIEELCYGYNQISSHHQKQDYYLGKRDRFNCLADSTEKSALFVFLNKTCFSGLYRVDKNGLFNVPMGGGLSSVSCDKDNIMSCSERLQSVEIICGDYKKIFPYLSSDAFIYIDPPRSSSPLTKYNFSRKEQKALAYFLKSAGAIGADFLLSLQGDDSNFSNLYDFGNIELINSHNGKGEIIVKNY